MVDDVEMDSETEQVELDGPSGTQETDVLGAPPDAALPIPEITELQRRLIETAHLHLGHPHHDQFMRVFASSHCTSTSDQICPETFFLSKLKTTSSSTSCNAEELPTEFSGSTR